MPDGSARPVYGDRMADRALEVLPDAEAVARRAAEIIAACARRVIAERGSFALALSGGRTPTRMIELLSEEDVPWDAVTVYQVDERIAPYGHPDRNLTCIERTLPQVAVVPMPVEDDDLGAAALRYGELLPDRLDLVHLGLGDDGHTASLVPGCAALEIRDRDVAISIPYHGRRRMTLTYPALDRAGEVLWVVTGEDKRDALCRLLADDPGIPASRVSAPVQLVLADNAASGR